MLLEECAGIIGLMAAECAIILYVFFKREARLQWRLDDAKCQLSHAKLNYDWAVRRLMERIHNHKALRSEIERLRTAEALHKKQFERLTFHMESQRRRNELLRGRNRLLRRGILKGRRRHG